MFSVDDCYILQNNFDALCTWSKTWKLDFSPSKCKIMSVCRSKRLHVFNYCLDGAQLERVNSFTDLGVNVCSNLLYSDHIKSIVGKANRMSFLLYRTTGKLVAENVMVRLFETLVRSHLEYCSQVWSPHMKRDIVLIEQVQRRFTKFLLYDRNLSYKERLLHLGLLPLSYRREIADLLFLYKSMNCFYDVDFHNFVTMVDHNGRLRSSSRGLLFKVQNCKTVTFQSSYFIRIVKLWNSLPLDVRQSSGLKQLRQNIKMFYHTKLVETFDVDNTRTWVSSGSEF